MKKWALDSKTTLFILMKGEELDLQEDLNPLKQHVILRESDIQSGVHSVEIFPIDADTQSFYMTYPMFQRMTKLMKDWSEALTTSYYSRQTVCFWCKRVKKCYKNQVDNRWYCKDHYDQVQSPL